MQNTRERGFSDKGRNKIKAQRAATTPEQKEEASPKTLVTAARSYNPDMECDCTAQTQYLHTYALAYIQRMFVHQH